MKHLPNRSMFVRAKYAGCRYVEQGGIGTRRLTAEEIEEFRAHIQRIIDPSLRVRSKYRRSIV